MLYQNVCHLYNTNSPFTTKSSNKPSQTNYHTHIHPYWFTYDAELDILDLSPTPNMSKLDYFQFCLSPNILTKSLVFFPVGPPRFDGGLSRTNAHPKADAHSFSTHVGFWPANVRTARAHRSKNVAVSKYYFGVALITVAVIKFEFWLN